MKIIQFSPSLKNSKIKVFCNVCDGDFTNEINSTLQSLNITKLSELQEYLVPAIMDRKHDIFVESHSGTGKKFGYILPIVNYIVEIQTKKTYQDDGNPFAIILMNDIESSKKVISEISRLHSGMKIIRLIGSDKEVNFIKEINDGCDIIVGSIIKFVKILQPINSQLLKRDILKVNFFVFDECEKLIHVHWENYLKIICTEILKKQIMDQIKIFSTSGLEDYTAEMLMKNYAQKDYVIMKFQNNLPPSTGKSLATFPIIGTNNSLNYPQKECSINPSSQNSENYPRVIFAQPQNNIVVNNYTNNQQFTSNQSCNDHPPLPMGHPFYTHHDNFSRSNQVKDTFCNVRYNPFRAQLVNPKLTVPSQQRGLFGSSFNFPSQQNKKPMKESFEDKLKKTKNLDGFTDVGLLRRFDVIEIELFDAYENLLTVLRHLFNENVTYKVIVFVRRAEGCRYGSNFCNINGIKSKAITKSHSIYEKKDNLEYFKSHQSVALFVEANYEPPIMKEIHSHVVITLNLSEDEQSFENKVKYLGDVDRNGGIFIIMGTSKIVSEKWIIERCNIFNIKD